MLVIAVNKRVRSLRLTAVVPEATQLSLVRQGLLTRRSMSPTGPYRARNNHSMKEK